MCILQYNDLEPRLEEEVETRAVDGSGNPYLTVEELMKQEAERRAGESLVLITIFFPARISPQAVHLC
jgi:hypothetical protein